jgi:choline transporter-like protein 2/4/5
MGERIVQDLNDSWPYIVGGLVIAMVLSLIYIVLMRWFAGIMVWFSLLGVIALLAYCKYRPLSDSCKLQLPVGTYVLA